MSSMKAKVNKDLCYFTKVDDLRHMYSKHNMDMSVIEVM